ncbi:MAG: rhodanese-like domain-containing protein [Akkermansia sp.]|nr:rhodanese-like domain-containing protein [Akkermansia sp.]
MKDTYTQVFRLGAVIVALAVVLYWADRCFFAPHRLPLCVQAELPPGRMCLETLHARYKNKVVWVDARSAADFELNHLMLSENRMFPIRKGPEMPHLVDAAIGRLLEAGEQGECIVVFCSGDCTAAEDVAQELRDLGMLDAPIYTLEGGWDALRADGFPTY